MGMDLSTADIMKLLQDKKLIDDVIAKVVGDPEALDGLAEDVADEISDYIEDDPAIRQRIINAAIGSADFRKRIVKELVDEIGDD